MRNSAILAATLLALAAASPQADAKDEAADFPSRNLTLVVPFSAGGPPDLIARTIGQELSTQLGKSVVIENRVGAAGSIAAASVMRAQPDGHTLLAVDISFVVTPHVTANLGVNPLKDFKSVGLTAKSVFILLTASSLGTPTLPSFIALVKEKKEAVTMAHSGVGSTPHLAALSFLNSTGLTPNLVPFRGMSDAVNNMLAGHIGSAFSAASTGIAQAGSGRVHLLGVTGEKRLAVLPDVPTFAENGVVMKGFENGSWYGIVAPVATPDPIVAKLNAAILKIAQDEGLRAKLDKTGLELASSTPGAFGEFLSQQYDFWGKTLRDVGTMPVSEAGAKN